jgi:hypothetical protein
MTHRHKAIPDEARDYPYMRPLRFPENPRAHGGITRKDICTCGATRLTNINGIIHREQAAWIEPAVRRGEALGVLCLWALRRTCREAACWRPLCKTNTNLTEATVQKSSLARPASQAASTTTLSKGSEMMRQHRATIVATVLAFADGARVRHLTVTTNVLVRSQVYSLGESW